MITVTLTNNSLESSEDVDIILTNEGDKYSVSEARYIEGAIDAHNTFEAPEVVDEKDLDVYKRQAWQSHLQRQKSLQQMA